MRNFIHKSFLLLTFSIICEIGCYSQSVIQLEKDGGVFKVPCVVNGLKLKLIFDTGASNVCISQSVALMMLENDYLSANDIKGTAQSQVADGRIVNHTKINLKKIQIGDKTLTNVEAVVVHGQTAPLLLGQSALKRLGRYSISGDKLIFGTELITSHSQMYTNESRKWLYNTLKNEGFVMGEYPEFNRAMDNDLQKRQWCFEQARKHGYNVGKDFDEFESLVGPQSTKTQINTYENRINVLSSDEIDHLFNDAINAYSEGAYSVALEKYEILSNNNLLSAPEIIDLADCYYYTDRIESALQTYLKIKDNIESNYPQHIVSLYYQIGRCLWLLEDFDAAIPYLEKVKFHAKPWSGQQSTAVGILSSIYDKKGDDYRSRHVVEEYINQYLAFMEIKPADCWDKLYVDKFLADLYYRRYLSSSSSEIEKYIIISAAWGNKEAIEYCKEKEIDYSSKPYKYEY